MKLFSSYLLIFLTLSVVHAQNYSVILGRPTNQSVTANVLFDQTVVLKVEYGTSPGVYSHSTAEVNLGANEPKAVVLSGLDADTRYYYRLKYRPASESSFRQGNECTFQTQRPPGASFSFTIEADPHPYDKKCYAPLWNIALQNQLADKPDFMIDMGDTFGDDHNPFSITSEEIRKLHADNRTFFGQVCHSVPLFLCLGNHEGESGYYLMQTPPNNLAAYGTAWRKYYYSNPSPDGFYSGNMVQENFGIGFPENYYAWQWGDALFVVLDAYRYYTANAKPDKWDWTIGKTQYDWLKQTLENSRARYKFVFAHHVLGEARGGANLASLYEWGGGDGKGSASAFASNRPGWEMPIHQLMVKNKVNIFFQGHDHLFAKEDIDGMVYQTVPMPSDASYALGITANGDAFGGIKLGGSGHLRVTVSPEKVQVGFVQAILSNDETAQQKNGDIAYSYTIDSSGLVTPNRNVSESFSGLKVWPNPFTNEINIQFELKKREPIEICISDELGNQVYNSPTAIKEEGVNSVKIKRDVDCKFKSGPYFIQVFKSSGILAEKMICIK